MMLKIAIFIYFGVGLFLANNCMLIVDSKIEADISKEDLEIGKRFKVLLFFITLFFYPLILLTNKEKKWVQQRN